MPDHQSSRTLLIQDARVYDHEGDVDQPPFADILIVDGLIAAVRPGIGKALAAGEPIAELAGRSVDEVIDGTDRLVVPGFVNSHYHSHDVLLKGVFETIPLELWMMMALPPVYPKRSSAEIRARTLLGAIECLRAGITTVQDLATIYPFDEEHLEVMLQAYEDVGIRCIFALQIADVTGAKSLPYWDTVAPPEVQSMLSASVEPFDGVDLRILVRDLYRKHKDRHPRLTWALGPSSPERCSVPLLEAIGDLSRSENLPVYTHIYESKAMTLIARQTHQSDKGSLINYLNRVGLLNPHLSLAHSVWMAQHEIEQIGAAGTNVVLNPVGNLKTRSGIAPIRQYVAEAVNVGLGCDNCSCSDSQNMFQSMKLFASLAGVTGPDPGPPTAADAIRSATLAGARAAGLSDKVGALKPGMAADLSIIDLTDPSFVPFNSAARQIVFTESGRGVETVIVDGRIVVRDRKITTIDERALREEVAELMKELRKDLETAMKRNAALMPYLLESLKKTWETDIGLNRHVAG